MMHTNNWKPLNVRDAKSYDIYIYIILLLLFYLFILVAPCGLAEFPIGESQCSRTSWIHFYQNKKATCTPPRPPLLDTISNCLIIHRRCAGIHVLSTGRIGHNYTNMT